MVTSDRLRRRLEQVELGRITEIKVEAAKASTNRTMELHWLAARKGACRQRRVVRDLGAQVFELFTDSENLRDQLRTSLADRLSHRRWVASAASFRCANSSPSDLGPLRSATSSSLQEAVR